MKLTVTLDEDFVEKIKDIHMNLTTYGYFEQKNIEQEIHKTKTAIKELLELFIGDIND